MAEVGTLRDARSRCVLGRVLADMVNSLNPAVLVLGGELSLAGRPLLEGIGESLRRCAQPEVVRSLRVCTATLADRAEMLGGAALAFADLVGASRRRT